MMKTFQQQFIECHNDGLCTKTRFESFESNPSLLPLFPKREASEKIKNGEIKGIDFILCGKFGGDCHSKNESCMKIRNI